MDFVGDRPAESRLTHLDVVDGLAFDVRADTTAGGFDFG